MKKKVTTLMLNKKSISSLKEIHILGGNAHKYEYFTSLRYCKTKCCSFHLEKGCTVTYKTCVTQTTFSEAF